MGVRGASLLLVDGARMVIRPLRPEDAPACDAIIASLPYHFALEGGRAECAAAVRSERGLVAEEDGTVVAFLTFVELFDAAAEITWMAVRSDRRRNGIGSRLLDRTSEVLVQEGRSVLALLTVSPFEPGDEPADGYQATRAFYERNGFRLVKDLPGIWDENLAVLMVRVLGASAQ
jgi:GNAT superfamily N-acetyltransferase